MHGHVACRQATSKDLPGLAALRWESVTTQQLPSQSEQEFIDEFVRWAAAHAETHVPFVAMHGNEYVGVAWLAIIERPPAPDEPLRRGGDLQSMYVRQVYRQHGIAARLIAAVLEHARARQLMLVTVLSSIGATTLYERAGFESSPQLLSIMRPIGQP